MEGVVVLGQYLHGSARTSPEKTGLVCGSKRLTYRELEHASNAVANFLIAEGLQSGDRASVFLDNSPETVITMFGVWLAGGCVVPVNTMTPPDRLAFLLEHSGAGFLFCNIHKLPVTLEAVKRCSKPPTSIVTGSSGTTSSMRSFDAVLNGDQSPPRREILEHHRAAIIYTSGSTGQPKGVTLTHGNIDTVVVSVTEYLGHSSDDVVLQFLPLSIGYGLLQLLVTFKNTGTLVLEKGFGFPYEIIKRIRDEKVTGFAGVPTVFSILSQFSQLDKEDVASLRYVTNAAAAMPPSFIPKLQGLFPTAKIFLMHGLTECLRTTFLPPEEITRRPTSVGKGMPGVKLWIENAEGVPLPAGEAGELVVYGKNIMTGYWNDQENTDKVLRYNQHVGAKALYTGDLFTMDEEGFFYFVARADEVIKCKGLKVSPLEVEDVIYQLEEVQEVRVIGVPDERFGQAIRAEVVLNKGCSSDAERVKAHCRARLEDYKTPHVVEFVSSLPKSEGGKIKRLA